MTAAKKPAARKPATRSKAPAARPAAVAAPAPRRGHKPPLIDASDELALAHGCWFDRKAGEHVCRFLEEFCRQSKAPFAGQPLQLMPWQRQFLMRLYGWKRADGSRRFRNAYLEIPKKNGKSTLVSGLVLYHLMADGEEGAECYVAACDRGQARIVFGEAVKMVRKSPDLACRLKVIDSQARIVHDESNSVLVAVSAEVDNKDGLNSSLVIFDELHRQSDSRLWDVFEYAGKTRRQPLRLSITTAGEGPHGVWYEQREYSEKVAAGTVQDWEHLGQVHRAEEGDDPGSPAIWRKANPSMDYTLREEDMAAAWRKAQETPRKMPDFLRLNLGLIRKAAGAAIDLRAWDRCKREINFAGLIGQKCWAGVDLSATTDLSALALLFEDWTLLIRAWIPDDPGLEEREKADKASYRAWELGGYLETCDGAVIDYDQIEQAIADEGKAYNIQAIGFDPYNATQLALGLRDDHGFKVEFVRQGYLSLNEPTKKFEELVLKGRLKHTGNPLLRWCAHNTAMARDPAGNIKFDKRRSSGRIDPIAAAVNAIAIRLACEAGEREERSGCDDPDYELLVLTL